MGANIVSIRALGGAAPTVAYQPHDRVAATDPSGTGLLAATQHALRSPALALTLRRYLTGIERIDALAHDDLQAVRISDRVLSRLSLAWLEPGNYQQEALRRALAQLRVFLFLRDYVAVEVMLRRMPGDPDLRVSLGHVTIDMDIHVPGQQHSLWQGQPPSGNPCVRIVDASDCQTFNVASRGADLQRYAAQFSLSGRATDGLRLRALNPNSAGYANDLMQSALSLPAIVIDPRLAIAG